MRVALLTSCELRHCFMAHSIAQRHELVLVLCEHKGLDQFYSSHPDSKVIAQHFQNLRRVEESFFSNYNWETLGAPRVICKRGQLNCREAVEALSTAQAQAVVVFGCGIVKPPLLECLPAGRSLNLHQGLSPFYRGSGTNFWPFLEGRPDHIGVTLHHIDAGIDTGAIVAHATPSIEAHDTLHTLGCKTVISSAQLLHRALDHLSAGHVLPRVEQAYEGKLYRRAELTAEAIERLWQLESSDFIPEFLRRSRAGEFDQLPLVHWPE